MQTPNILFIMSDDHASKAISAYYDEYISTPNIDRLANEGMIFRNSFVTNAICGPSRAVLLTGLHSHLNGVRDNHTEFNAKQTTFPSLLRENGYTTALVGKWHLQSSPEGFDYWNILPGQGDYYNPAFIENGRDTAYEGYVTGLITDLAMDWLDELDDKKPFCLMVHQKAPHRNWMPDLSHLDAFETDTFEVPETYYEDLSSRPSLSTQQLTISQHMNYQYDLKIPCDTCDVAEVNSWAPKVYQRNLARMNQDQIEKWNKGYSEEKEQFFTEEFIGLSEAEWKYKRYMEDYLRCIISVDESVGSLLDYLEQRGLLENTIVIYTSDQGFFLGEHGLFDKRYMYEESMGTPLLMRYPPLIEKSSENSDLVQNLDIAPTLLQLAGVEVPEEMQGLSLLPLFSESSPEDWRDALYYHFYESGWGVEKHEGVRTDRYKLIHFYEELNTWELFDLKDDPEELNNLYGLPGNDSLVNSLKTKLNLLKEQYDVPSL
jgi:arylsulfatase A-like enzyme